MTNRVAAACAAVPGSDEQLASRALTSFDGWSSLQPVGSFREARRNLREHRRMRRDAVDVALENERKSRAVGVAPLVAWGLWLVARVVVEKLLLKLFDWWWNNRTQPAGDDA